MDTVLGKAFWNPPIGASKKEPEGFALRFLF
jgi:hypothetical protein